MAPRTPTEADLMVAIGISKRFGGVQALRDVDLVVRKGEVHGLVGANGAGKSTFIRLLAGVHTPDSGSFYVNGEPVSIATPHEAVELGFSFIHQELNLVPGFSALKNMSLGLPKAKRFGLIDWSRVRRQAQGVADRLGMKFDLDTSVEDLSVADQWLVSIGRALLWDARLIAMDEPTASLSAQETEQLFQIVRDLTDQGIAILYVSHRLDEILELCDKVTVFRDGRKVVTSDRENLTKMHLVESIVGSEFVAADQVVSTEPDSEKPVVLEVRDLERSPMVRGVSFELREGEVLGLAGLVGAGRTETARLIFGADRPDGGTILLKGTEVSPRSPSDAAHLGIGLVPEERRAQGLILDRSIDYNLNLTSFSELKWARAIPLIRFDKARRRAVDLVERLAIKTPTISTPARQLSGGNQQKIVIGKWVGRQPSVLILDEPSRGVDVGARVEIHNIIKEHARAGAGVIVISSEVEEMIGLCDRVLVMAEGTIVGSLTGGEITKENIVALSYAHAPKGGLQ